MDVESRSLGCLRGHGMLAVHISMNIDYFTRLITIPFTFARVFNFVSLARRAVEDDLAI